VNVHEVIVGAGIAAYCAAFYALMRWSVGTDERLRRAALHPIRRFGRRVQKRITGRVRDEEDYAQRFIANQKFTFRWIMRPILVIVVVIALGSAIRAFFGGG